MAVINNHSKKAYNEGITTHIFYIVWPTTFKLQAVFSQLNVITALCHVRQR